MSGLAITGASSFLGGALLNGLALERFSEVRVLVHHHGPRSGSARTPGIVEVKADLLDRDSLREFGAQGATVVHLAYLATSHPEDDNVTAMRNLLSACHAAGVRRFIHCSSAVVVGKVRCDVVNEDTPCAPGNAYEAAKLAVERVLLQERHPDIETAVLRPTAIFGPGGKNLLRLAGNLVHQSRLVNYARSCLQGHRRMNLVHVDNVVAALKFLIDRPAGAAGEIYIVSDDDSPLNNYRDVEQCLARELEVPYYSIPPLTLPSSALALALATLGRSNTNPNRAYDGSRLLQAGLTKPMPFAKGLRSFASWYRAEFCTAGGTN